MNKVLGQLSIAFGGMLFVAVMLMAVSNGVPILTSVFRAWVVMCVGSIAIALFLRVLSSILYRFVAEQVMLQRNDNSGASVSAAGNAGIQPDNKGA